MSYTVVVDEHYNRLQIANAFNEFARHCRVTNVRWKSPVAPHPGRLAGWKPTREFFELPYVPSVSTPGTGNVNPLISWTS